MNQKKALKSLPLLIFSLSLISFFGFSPNSLAVEEDLDPSLLTPEIEKEIEEYSSGIISKTTFEKEFTETLPFYTDRFTGFDIEIDSASKSGYNVGERLSVSGSLSFNQNVENAYLDFRKECLEGLSGKDKSRCLLSPTFFFDNYPETGLFVQIWKKDKSEKTSLNGDSLIDEFYVLDGFDLKKGEKKSFAINWKLPNGLEAGSYYLALSVLANKNFELFGTPLLANAPKKLYNFEVKNEKGNLAPEIDKNLLKINELNYNYRSPAPAVEAKEDGKVSFEIPVINYSTEKKVSVRYELYKWSQTDPKNLLDSKEESLVLKAKERKTFAYAFTPGDLESVYNLRVSVKSEDGQSITNLRFVIKGKDKGVFRFLGLAKDRSNFYPFFCLKDANWEGLFQGEVQIELKDSLGNLITSMSEKANIRPETRCFIAFDTKLSSAECLVLSGKISNGGGKTVDEKELSIPCGAIKESKAEAVLKKIEQELPFRENKSLILIFVFILFILGGIFIYLNKKKKNDES